MTDKAGCDLGDLSASLPVGIVRIDARAIWTLLQKAKAGDPSLTAAGCDQRLLRALVDASVIQSANDAAARMLEADAGGAPGLPLATRLSEKARNAFVAGLFHIFEGKGPFSAGTTISLKNGNERQIYLSIWSVDGDEPPAFIGIAITDIVDGTAPPDPRETRQGALAHAARISMLGEMTASIAHEVNQPLSSIVTNAEAGLRWLDRDRPDFVEVKAILKRIVRGGNRAAGVIAAMRSLAKDTRPQRNVVCLNTLVVEASMLLRSELIKRQVALTLELAADAPATLIDRTQILQVVINLALNAAEAMEGGSPWDRTLVIRTRSDRQAAAVVEVEDSGPGVDPTARERLFETFYTTKESGSGLGLGICRSIVEAHGHSIALESSSPVGARFSFKLPLSPLG